MNRRENLLSLLRRTGFEKVPVDFTMCPDLIKKYEENTGSKEPFETYFEMPLRNINGIIIPERDTHIYEKFYDFKLKSGTIIDNWGVAHEPGSEAAKHMTYMRHPLKNVQELEEMMEYPFPDFKQGKTEHMKSEVENLHKNDLVALGQLQCTIWEIAWYIRSMEELMIDMKTEDPKAEFILDKMTEDSIIRAEAYAKAGVDILFLGDDIGMQSSIMMSEELYCDWIKNRLKNIISSAKAIKPDIIIFYHSCGYIYPMIKHLIDAGIDVLNPVQPECMNFKNIHSEFGGSLSFHGTIGTQTTMPFGTPDDVRREVYKNLDIAGDKGGLFVGPTHILEPEVPWENVLAYVKACNDFK